jgi:sugar phosphate isomerase/epimerase
MNLPTNVLSHCLARGSALNYELLERNLVADLELGYAGAVIVPALLPQNADNDSTSIARIYCNINAQGLVCGFIPGNGPDHLGDDMQPALDLVAAQMKFAVALAEVGCGPDLIVGPLHTQHRTMRPHYPHDRLKRWLDALSHLAEDFGLDVLFEPLNAAEDGTPDAFETIYNAIQEYPIFGLHYDTGHASAWGLGESNIERMAHKIGYLEIVNDGRWPLNHTRGIRFESVALAMRRLPDDCIVGVEPFDQSVIKDFQLAELCRTTVPGPQALVYDAAFLRELEIME